MFNVTNQKTHRLIEKLYDSDVCSCDNCKNIIDRLYYFIHSVNPNHLPSEKKKIGSILRISVYRRDNFTCQICGISPEIINNHSTQLCIDHIYPESKGGKTELKNLQTLCRSCNSKKSSKIEQRK